VIDACAHPVVAKPTDLSDYIARPYRGARGARFAEPNYGPYPMAGDPYVAGSTPAGGGLPGSDIELFRQHVLDDPGADHVVLLGLGRGLLGDASLAAAIDAATNDWLASAWLDSEHNADGRLRGSIRVSPRLPGEAVREIERWAEHPHFTQVAVPLESLTPYGEPDYFPIWKAAAEHGLPVAIHSEHNVGVEKTPTATGYPTTYLEQYAQTAVYAVSHVDSLIAFGVFDRLPSLKVVLADGGFDYFETVMWRVDKDWRATISEVPMITRPPSQYVADHVRIVVGASDGRQDPEAFRRFLELSPALAGVLMYGSNYPSWDHLPAEELSGTLPGEWRERIMDGTARELYGLPVAA
jgi:predicted TIM-barrel fold metal-dependent hydrolase